MRFYEIPVLIPCTVPEKSGGGEDAYTLKVVQSMARMAKLHSFMGIPIYQESIHPQILQCHRHVAHTLISQVTYWYCYWSFRCFSINMRKEDGNWWHNQWNYGTEANLYLVVVLELLYSIDYSCPDFEINTEKGNQNTMRASLSFYG